MDASVMVVSTYQPKHVVAYVREGSRFRLYDNDSVERRRGTFRWVEAQSIVPPGVVTAVLPRASLLNVELNEVIMQNLAAPMVIFE